MCRSFRTLHNAGRTTKEKVQHDHVKENTNFWEHYCLMPSADKGSLPVELGFEEIAEQLYPAGPKISPDGRTVAFTVTARSRKGEHTERAVWLSRDGEPARRFSGGDTDDREVSFSPDGRMLAFLTSLTSVP